MARPVIRQTVVDAEDARAVAEFYRALLDLVYRPGDEPPLPGQPDDLDWLVLRDREGRPALAVQQVERLAPTTWPDDAVPMQLHLDCTVPDQATLEETRQRVSELGGRHLLDRSADPEEPLHVFADPAGHPFCVFVD